jgi:hypothetical protein
VDVPAAVVDEGVVVGAEQYAVLGAGVAAVDPVGDVVDLAAAGAAAAAGVGAVAVAVGDRAAEREGGDAVFAAEVEDFAVAAELECPRCDGQPSCCLVGYLGQRPIS